MRCRATSLWAAIAASVLVLAACGGGGDDDASTVGPTSTIAPADSSSTAPISPPSPATTDASYPTTTIHEVPATCAGELDAVLASVEESILAARLEPGGDWTADTSGATFDERTHSAEEFRYRMGLDCLARLTQQTSGGDDRLLLLAWTGERLAWVVQSTDGPATPFRQEQRIQLFIAQPFGEWLVDQFVWAGSLESGETVIVGTVDTSFGVAAKSWWNEVPRFGDLDVTNDAERYGIDVLLQAGARNVSVAEPADYQSEIAAIQFVTPEGLHLIATVAPPEWFDPRAELVEGEMTVEQVDGVDLYVTTAVPESYAVASVGWQCGDVVWFIDSSWGTVDELVEWAEQLISSAEC